MVFFSVRVLRMNGINGSFGIKVNRVIRIVMVNSVDGCFFSCLKIVRLVVLLVLLWVSKSVDVIEIMIVGIWLISLLLIVKMV